MTRFAVIALFFATSAMAARPTEVGAVYGSGMRGAIAVARDARQGDRVYITYNWAAQVTELRSINLKTGATRSHTISSDGSSMVYAMTVGADGRLYIGVSIPARLLVLDGDEIRDLGRIGSEEYVWDLVTAGDGNIYAGTFPNAKLFRFDLKAKTLNDLGRMHEGARYARSLLAAGNLLYVGLPMSNSQVVAYDLATGERHVLLTADDASDAVDARVAMSSSGTPIARLRYISRGEQVFLLNGLTATSTNDVLIDGKTDRRLSDGREVLDVDCDQLLVSNEAQSRTERIAFAEPVRDMRIYRLHAHTDGRVYGGTYIPASLFRFDPQHDVVETLAGVSSPDGRIGIGQIYSFVSQADGTLAVGGYSTPRPIIVYDEDGLTPMTFAGYEGEDTSWRALAATRFDDTVFFGAIAGYHRSTGRLLALNGSKVSYVVELVPGHNITSLASFGRLLVGAVMPVDGGDASLFLYDPVKRIVTKRVAVPGLPYVTSLTVLGNRVFAIGGARNAANELIVFDLDRHEIVHRARIAVRVGSHLYNAMAVVAGRIYGLDNHGVFAIDPSTLAVTRESTYDGTITAGFANMGRDLYFASQSRIFRYTIPIPDEELVP